MSQSNIVKSSRSVRIGGYLGGWLMKLFASTLRIEVIDNCGITKRENFPDPVIYALWHNRIFVLPALFRRFCPWRSAVALISPSKDGTALEFAFKVLNIGAARGSSSRGGAGALIALRRAIRAGHDTGITPDGPKGPVYVVKPGIIKLAESSGAPIVPLFMTFSRVWRLKSWDSFIIPFPFSKVSITFGEIIPIPKGQTAETLADQANALQALLLKGVR
jgi:lysophospholipid acyltransferase (LPLAT)-like uncharacterized protein